MQVCPFLLAQLPGEPRGKAGSNEGGCVSENPAEMDDF